MKYTIVFALLFTQLPLFAQHSEDLIPEEATSVLSINNVNLLQKISLDELVQYRFMEELYYDIMDGSTTGWTLKDSGVDFDQKLNIFMGRNDDFAVSGITFGVSDQNRLFKIFDDFQPIESSVPGVDMYASLFNRLAIKNNAVILYRIEPDYALVNYITDSIWYARGNGYHWENYELEEEVWEEGEQMETDEWVDPDQEEPILSEDIATGKNYYELLDSVETSFHERYLEVFTNNLFISGNNLVKGNAEFAAQMQITDSEGTYFVNNSENLRTENDFRDLTEYYPGFHNRIAELYSGNTLSGSFYLADNQIELELTARYGDELGAIYEQLGTAKFNKKMLPYMHKESIGYATSNIDLEDAFDLSFETALSIFNSSERPDMIAMAMALDVINEYVDKDKLFDTYKGGMFTTYSGIQKVHTTKIVFEYDEQTFEYTEREEIAEEDMPVFVWGFTTEEHEIGEKILNYMGRIFASRPDIYRQQLINHGDYWEITNGFLQSVSMYVINKNGVFVFTNNEALAKGHSNGYGSQALKAKDLKKAKTGGIVYAYADMTRAISELPEDIFTDRENELLEVFRDKNGTIELTSEKSTGNSSDYALTYTFETEEDSGKYILDLINSLYVISK